MPQYSLPMSPEETQRVLNVHEQKDLQNLCSASAHELIGKLHGKIQPDAYPLQSCTKSLRAGFEFEWFLNELGFTGETLHKSPQETAKILTHETAEGRYPLVSWVAGEKAHILIALHKTAQVALYDPGTHEFESENNVRTLEFLKGIVSPHRPLIHQLTYKLRQEPNRRSVDL